MIGATWRIPLPATGVGAEQEHRNSKRENANISYRPTGGGWSVAAYGRNITDERYDNARLNTGDYVLIMLSNDASEFGVRVTKNF